MSSVHAYHERNLKTLRTSPKENACFRTGIRLVKRVIRFALVQMSVTARLVAALPPRTRFLWVGMRRFEESDDEHHGMQCHVFTLPNNGDELVAVFPDGHMRRMVLAENLCLLGSRHLHR